MKLTDLVEETRQLFLEGKITAGHAILLARLKPEDQQRAIGDRKKDNYHGEDGGLFQHERVLFNPDDPDDETGQEHVKVRSVRELAGWIDQHVKLEVAEIDQMVLPETAAILETAEEQMKLLRITRENITPEELREGPKAILGRSWQRADGRGKSKVCAHARLAMVVIGPGRGEAFQVCIDKKSCAVHWPEHVKAAKAAAKAAASGTAKASPAKEKKPKLQFWEIEQQKRKEIEAREDAERARFMKVMPAILDAVAGRINLMPTKASGTLARIVIDEIAARNESPALKKNLGRVPLGTTAEDVIRYLAYYVFLSGASHYFRPAEFVKEAAAFGVDAKQFLEPKPLQTSGKKPIARGKAKASRSAARA